MNTGNIGRLSLASGCHLHLVQPFGFELDDKRVKRAGLDYWQHISLHTYAGIDDFFTVNAGAPMAFFSSHGKRSYLEVDYTDGTFLIFGKESVGLSQNVRETHADQLFHIPLHSNHVRSLNLANAVSIVVYEGLRNLSL